MTRILVFFSLLSAGVLLIKYGMPDAAKGQPRHLLAWMAGWGFVIAALAATGC